jgi:hypothetical protein
VTSDGKATPATDKPAGDDKKAFVTPQMVQIEAELTAQRAQLASTVDELAGRLDPRTQAAKAVEESKQLFRDAVDPDAAPDARRRAQKVLGGVAAGVAAVAAGVWLRRR